MWMDNTQSAKTNDFHDQTKPPMILTFRLPAESPGEFEVGLALRMLTAVSEAPAEPPTGQGPARPSRLLPVLPALEGLRPLACSVLPGCNQVWSLTQSYSVDFLQSSIGVKRCFLSRFVSARVEYPNV